MMDVISTERLFSSAGPAGLSPDLRKLIAKADVIIGVDRASQCEYTVFGTPSLEETVPVGAPVGVPTVRVELDEAAGELDRLVDLVRAIKSGLGT